MIPVHLRRLHRLHIFCRLYIEQLPLMGGMLMARRMLLLIIIMQILCCSWILQARLLFEEYEALKSIRRRLADMPGSSFFVSWDFSKDPCNFTGVLCSVVDGVKRVTILTLGEVTGNTPGLSGKLSSAIGNLAALQQLTLVPGKVAGTIPYTLGNISNLEFVGLSKNYISGCIPDSLANLKQLKTLDLSYNRISGTIPVAIASLPNFTTLMLARNLLSGNIPVFTAPLAHLDLTQNKLHGTLPILPCSLYFLDLSFNQLSGPLDQIVVLESLRHLDLSFNQFSGWIASSIFGLKLDALLLQRNQLSGSIEPPGLVVIPTIDLSFNHLSGFISPFLAFVQNLYLNNNKFIGAVPQEFVDQLLSASLQTLFLQHNFLTSFVIDPRASLPASCSVCLNYNCMGVPNQTPCPVHGGARQSRPASQCKNVPP